MRAAFLPGRGPFPNLSKTNLRTTSVCSSLFRLISCTLSVVFDCKEFNGDSELELRFIGTSKLLVGESKVRDIDLLNVSLADLHIAGEYNLIEHAPLRGVDVTNLVFIVSAINGGETSEFSASTSFSLSSGGDISDRLNESI